MPQIPTLPTTEPLVLPKASPGEFASPGATIAELGSDTAQMAQANMAFEGRLIEAQRYLKYKQIEINVGRLEAQAHDELSRATTPEAAQEIHAKFKEEVNQALEPYLSDKALARQLHIYGQQKDVMMQNTVNARKATIIDTNDKVANKELLENSIKEAINVRAAGGDDASVRAAVEAKLDASVHVIGSLFPEQKKALMNEYDKEVDAGYLDAMLGSENLTTVQNTVNDLRLHPDKYSHLDKAQINALINKGENAIVSRMSLQDEIDAKTEEKKYWNQSSTGIPRMFTDVNGNFNEAKALEYISKLGLSPAGEKKLIGDVKTHGAAADTQLQSEAAKAQNEIVDAAAKGNERKVNELLGQFKVFADQHTEFSDVYKSLVTFDEARKSQRRSEAMYARGLLNEKQRLEHEQWQFDSFDTLGKISKGAIEGRYSDTDLRSMTGRGPGKMLPAQVEEAIHLSHSIEDDPNNKPYIISIWNDPSLSTPIRGKAINEFSNWLRQNPKATDDQKAAAVKRIVEPEHIQNINNSIDELNEKLINPNKKPSKGFFDWFSSRMPAKESDAPAWSDMTAKAPESTKAPEGVTRFRDGGKIYRIQEDAIEEFKVDHPNATEVTDR